jgi:hypothetical protein
MSLRFFDKVIEVGKICAFVPDKGTILCAFLRPLFPKLYG